MGTTVTKIGTLSPDELADLCRQVEGCRVELNGTTYGVYPPGEGTRPVYFSSIRLRTAPALENKIRDLRRNGIDIREIANNPKPTPPKPPQENATVSAPARTPTDISPTITRREAADLRDQVRAASDTAVSLLAEADKAIRQLREQVEDQGASIDELRAEVRDLHAQGRVAGRAPTPKPVSIASQVRDAVLAFFVAHPGMRLTPTLIEANIGDTLPAARQTTSVGHACKELVRARKLQGGATRDTPAARKGIYWYEPPADKA